ncbi:hypothetical protein SDC9_90008 [bioreactor metagenome]|uniref:Uncharacterized protein n=1 Tax=bioreactor metagenome TaxID=1076179 RepID=A0A644ZR17_9ZZZZ
MRRREPFPCCQDFAQYLRHGKDPRFKVAPLTLARPVRDCIPLKINIIPAEAAHFRKSRARVAQDVEKIFLFLCCHLQHCVNFRSSWHPPHKFLLREFLEWNERILVIKALSDRPVHNRPQFHQITICGLWPHRLFSCNKIPADLRGPKAFKLKIPTYKRQESPQCGDLVLNSIVLPALFHIVKIRCRQTQEGRTCRLFLFCQSERPCFPLFCVLLICEPRL